MIRVTKFDGSSMVLNAEWIQTVEATPDTVITLTNGSQILVKDSVDAVVEAFREYKIAIQLPEGKVRKAT